ncbi:hypothetical protein THASP1DRAFT_26103 [Thamnocephalis sphaerospora]|uniref:Uncharacterized protein n=1 Tax=Thamnocephalis sphaerospora TaxID=78915 RepID=A0A4P9XJM7_9FUNG|nr:hypothetical protein THASP1DRAFT_26103 [Thamnocephalis sphaerospora]|eukprot:RKP05390.1 hypothetical protein THASP1DRAFT_26103 [Thamnocephalis sphaerospora]
MVKPRVTRTRPLPPVDNAVHRRRQCATHGTSFLRLGAASVTLPTATVCATIFVHNGWGHQRRPQYALHASREANARRLLFTVGPRLRANRPSAPMQLTFGRPRHRLYTRGFDRKAEMVRENIAPPSGRSASRLAAICHTVAHPTYHPDRRFNTPAPASPAFDPAQGPAARHLRRLLVDLCA